MIFSQKKIPPDVNCDFSTESIISFIAAVFVINSRNEFYQCSFQIKWIFYSFIRVAPPPPILVLKDGSPGNPLEIKS